MAFDMHSLRRKVSSLETKARELADTHLSPLLSVPGADGADKSLQSPSRPYGRAPPSPLQLHSGRQPSPIPSPTRSIHQHQHSPASPSRLRHDTGHHGHGLKPPSSPSHASHRHASEDHAKGHARSSSHSRLPDSPRSHDHSSNHSRSSSHSRHPGSPRSPRSPHRHHGEHAHGESSHGEHSHHEQRSPKGRSGHQGGDRTPTEHEHRSSHHDHHRGHLALPEHGRQDAGHHNSHGKSPLPSPRHSPSTPTAKRDRGLHSPTTPTKVHHHAHHSSSRDHLRAEHGAAGHHRTHSHERSHSHRGSDRPLVLSYPPRSTRSCTAEDAAAAIISDRSSAWWAGHITKPPAIEHNHDLAWSGRFNSTGNDATVVGTALFADLSMLYYCVHYPVSSYDPHAAHIEALFVPRPEPLRMDAHPLNDAIARFAESAEAHHRVVGNGECRTLASEAIKSIGDHPSRPVPSIGRTHGSLVYLGRAEGGVEHQVGQWRTGDNKIRRGDIVEWREAKVSTGAGSMSTLGAPCHTAVVVSDATPAHGSPHLMQAVKPLELGWLEVIEQSAGKLPTRHRYDLSTFCEGEMWIYRPCSLAQLGLPDDIGATWPPPVAAFPPR